MDRDTQYSTRTLILSSIFSPLLHHLYYDNNHPKASWHSRIVSSIRFASVVTLNSCSWSAILRPLWTSSLNPSKYPSDFTLSVRIASNFNSLVNRPVYVDVAPRGLLDLLYHLWSDPLHHLGPDLQYRIGSNLEHLILICSYSVHGRPPPWMYLPRDPLATDWQPLLLCHSW